MTRQQQQVRIKNKKANFLYEILDKYTAGIQLLGTEIKSIRESQVSLTEAYCALDSGELYIRNMNISEYANRGYMNHETRRERKLLLTKRELSKLEKKIKERGFAIIPLVLFINDKGLAKIEIALARGKKQFDKRQDIKDRDNKRDLDRMKKH